ncbi:hypothetical protein CFOLD11_11490 [Clostridium folliculivorans]|uniref:Uncharacterized protein n=1 Tax=Clostridium folliculivorans TaxID=2886038 RepID=A0A9W5Y0F9_9CLOT|nr:hypothetical protein [Clostridium folliculivorans]GKU24323.1 hypothetical protein CFOLD11_11490 [Clostridium folliculivorans]
MKKNTKVLFLCVVVAITLIIPILGGGHANLGSGVVTTMGDEYPSAD